MHAEVKPYGLARSMTTYLHETSLGTVMGFLPLQQAFGEFCRKALCSEVSVSHIVEVDEHPERKGLGMIICYRLCLLWLCR